MAHVAHARVKGLGFKDLGFRVKGLGFRVKDLGFRVWDGGSSVYRVRLSGFYGSLRKRCIGIHRKLGTCMSLLALFRASSFGFRVYGFGS